MEYMGNEQFWDNKFEVRSDNLLSPEKSLIENIEYLKKGSVLDIACGDGRNTIYLIENGFKVTGVDFSSKALERLIRFAKRNNYLVNTQQVDLSIANSLEDIGIFDNILINHYRLNEKQFLEIEKHITDGGILFICGFGHKHKVDMKIREEDLIQREDFQYIGKSFELIRYIEKQDNRGFIVTYIFKKIKRLI